MFAACAAATAAAWAGDPQSAAPQWAYPINPPAARQVVDGKVPRHVPASRAAYTDLQIDDLFLAPDWHPEEHPPAPSIVTHGRAPDVYACGHCHRMTGSGGPENAKLAGLPADYILRQLQDYQRGLRRTAVASRVPQTYMMSLAKHLTPEEMVAAAAYFSAAAPVANIHIVESAQVPRSHVEGWRLALDPEGALEPIGRRIIEVPDRPVDFERRDSRATFRAFVPPGSLARGQSLANAGAGTIACAVCHGPQLLGLGLAPPLAGKSPTYMVRQLYEIQSGIRGGTAAAPMKAAIAGLSVDDMIAAAAWAASLPPGR